MISRPPPIGNIWLAAAAAWFISFGAVLLYFWPVLYQMGYATKWLIDVAWLWVAGSIMLALIGWHWKEKPRRSLFVVVVAALFAYLPLTAACSLVGFSYLYLVQLGTDWALVSLALLVAVLLWWCIREVKSLAHRIIDRRFIEREFSVEEDRIVFRRPHLTDVDAPPVSKKSLFGKIYYKVGPYLVMLVPFAYPLQRLVVDTGGIQSFIVLCSILVAPLAIHALGRFSCGAYLYGYKVWQIEKQHQKPVVFEQV